MSQNKSTPTNKFYANLFLGSQSQGVWTHPYSVTWSKGRGNAASWGLAISHIDSTQRAYGPPNPKLRGNPVQYFINPIGIQSIILSAVELGPSTVLTSDELRASSASLRLQPYANSPSKLTFPLVQGMGFVTANYEGLQPAIESSVFFRNVVCVASPRAGIFKYRIVLEDNKTWLVYAVPRDGQDPRLSLVSNLRLEGPQRWSGIIQVAKSSGDDTETIYDRSAGVYAVGANVTGSSNGSTGTYRIDWTKAGYSTKECPATLLMFALPHHLQSFSGATATSKTAIRLQTTTKGIATAIIADSWALVESKLPTDVYFTPWSPLFKAERRLSSRAHEIIYRVAISEIRQDMGAQTNLNSMYFSGKALGKFATIVYVVYDLLQEPILAREGLENLKAAFARFATNQQIHPLVYDTVWKGIVSSGSYSTGDPGQDFGNTYYNDHHFHYGYNALTSHFQSLTKLILAYFVYTAAVIAYLEPTWLQANKDFVNILVRDVSSPTTQDPYFPFSRSFDWYHGHSFAKGLYESADSKDEESTSEDAFFSYALKLWGYVIGDKSMEARGNLMLAIQARSFQNYFLMENGNSNQPANFIANKVTGIVSLY